MNKIFRKLFGLIIFIFPLTLVGCSNRNLDVKEITVNDLKDYTSIDNPIDIYVWYSGASFSLSEILDNAINQFEEEMARNEIYINVNATYMGKDDELYKQILVSRPTNNLPSVILFNTSNLVNYYNNGFLLPLNDFIDSKDESISLNEDEFVDTCWQSSIMKDTNENEIITSIPFYRTTDLMYYNSSAIDPILQELGYGDEVDGERAWTKPTWEQVANVSKEIINKINNGGISWEYKSNKYSIKDDIIPTSFNSDGYNANSFSFFLNTAKQWCSNDEEASTVYSNEKGQITFKNEIVLAAQEYFLEKAYDGLWNPSEYDDESLITISSISAAMNYVENEKECEIKCTTYPQKSYDNTSYQTVMQEGKNFAIINKNYSSDDNYTNLASWLLIKYLTNAENNTKFVLETGNLPVRYSVYESKDLNNYLNSPFVDKSFLKVFPTLISQREYFEDEPILLNGTNVKQLVKSMIYSIYKGGYSIVDAINGTYIELKKLGIECIDVA